ncbi:MAG: hypothetical protein V1685_04305 [Parcubacteria group bacterium]
MLSNHRKQLVSVVIALGFFIIFGVSVYSIVRDREEDTANSPGAATNQNVVNTNQSLTAGCEQDDDCIVWGCSNHLCGLRDAVSDQVTTCEYRDEYACVNVTQCSCFSGECMWQPTEAYESCLAQYQ